MYPEQKLKDTENVLRNFWTGNEKIVFSTFSDQPYYKQLDDKDEMIKKAVDNIIASADLPGFNIPRFIPDFGTVSTASYWGGKIYTPVGGCKGIKPIIQTAVEALNFKPSEAKGGDVAKAIELWKSISGKLGTDQLYCSMFDIQGPLNTAALLWNQGEFMMAMYTDPAIVHALLEQITDHIIKIIHAMRVSIPKISGPMWPNIWLPSDIGVGITEDYMPLISPALYKEFGIPYLKKINDAFGGVFIHCCGEYEHQIENIKSSGINLLGLEFHYPHINPETLFKAFGNSIAFVPYVSPQGTKDFPNRLEYIKYLKEKRQCDTRLWFILSPDEIDYMEQVKLLENMR